MKLPSISKDQYLSAKPFPYVIIDEALDPRALDCILIDWPEQHDRFIIQDDQKFKGTTYFESSMPPSVYYLLRELNSQSFILWLEQLTGINGLIPDPLYIGGGLAETFPGGKTMIHTDFTHHPTTGLHRRINILVYLNKEWRDEYKGDLQLWTKSPELPDAISISVAPHFNRMVIFNTTGESYHGHPEPLACPKGMSRKSFALYYYTNTVSTEPAKASTFVFRKQDKPKWWKQFIPPIVFRAYNAIK